MALTDVKRWMAWGASLLVLAAGASTGAQTGRSPFALLVEQVQALFPKVMGEVLEVHGQELTLSLGRRDGLQTGVELSLFREGRELRHPKTGKILGRTEQPLGQVSVDQVFEVYSTGTVRGSGDIRPGDTVRVSAGKIKLMLVPLSSGVKDDQVEAAVQELTEEIDRTGRFQVMLGDAVSVRLAQEGIKAEEAIEGKGLAAAAKGLGVEYLLAILFRRAQSKPYMEVRLFSDPATSPLLTTALFVPSLGKPQPREQFSTEPQQRQSPPPRQRSLLARLLGWDQDTGAYSSSESTIPLKEVGRFGFPVLAMDVAVSPRDKIPRLVFTDGTQISLYRIVNRALEPEWTYAAGPIGRVISVQLADLDDDGVLEVVANRYHPKEGLGLTSFILTTKEGKPSVVVQDLSQILLAVDMNGEGVKKTLWMQRFASEGFFAKGQAEHYSLRTGTLVREGPLRVPQDFRATGATMSNIAGKGPRALVYVDAQNRLAIAIEGAETWRSATRVGGGGYLKLEVFKQLDQAGKSFFYSMEPLPLAVDLDGDGIEEIVVPQNQTPGMLAVVSRGPAGYRFQSINSGFEGTITGLGAVQGKGAPTLIASVVRFTGILGVLKQSGETQIIMTTPE